MKKIFKWTGIILLLIIVVFQILSYQTITLHHEVLINAPKEKVWLVLNNIEEVENYNPQVSDATCLSDNHEGVNASRQCTMDDGTTVKEKVLAIDPGNSMTMELYESSWPVKNMKWTTSIETKDGATLVKQDLEYNVRYGAFGALLNTFVMKNKMNASINEVFSELKKYVESK